MVICQLCYKCSKFQNQYKSQKTLSEQSSDWEAEIYSSPVSSQEHQPVHRSTRGLHKEWWWWSKDGGWNHGLWSSSRLWQLLQADLQLQGTNHDHHLLWPQWLHVSQWHLSVHQEMVSVLPAGYRSHLAELHSSQFESQQVFHQTWPMWDRDKGNKQAYTAYKLRYYCWSCLLIDWRSKLFSFIHSLLLSILE